jgi:hypothetical protein
MLGIGTNGGLIGPRRVPNGGSASGIWDLEEQKLAKGAGLWPINVSGDPSFNNVGLLLHMDGSNGSTVFADSSINNATFTQSGSPTISTAQSKFGGSSGYFNGSSYVTTPMTTALQFGTGDFTIEGWFYPLSSGSYSTPFSLNLYNDGILLRMSGTQNAGLFVNGTEYSLAFAANPFSTNTWTHLALVRSSGVITLYIQGVSVFTDTNTAAISPSGTFYLGVAGHASNEIFNGYIDEFRITKAVARYNANYTPPAEAFPS